MAESLLSREKKRFETEILPLSQFALKKTGILTTQTVIKIENYSLLCVPYQVTYNDMLLIAALSQNELVFFQRYKNSLVGLTLYISLPDRKEPQKLFCRCSLVTISPMKNRENVAIIAARWKPCPPDIENVLTQYFLTLEKFRAIYDKAADGLIMINPESAKGLGFNNYATITVDGSVMKMAVFALSMHRIDFLLPMKSPDVSEGSKIISKLFFKSYQFSVKGVVEKVERLPTGVQKCRISLAFSPELAEIIDSYNLYSKVPSKSHALQ